MRSHFIWNPVLPGTDFWILDFGPRSYGWVVALGALDVRFYGLATVSFPARRYFSYLRTPGFSWGHFPCDYLGQLKERLGPSISKAVYFTFFLKIIWTKGSGTLILFVRLAMVVFILFWEGSFPPRPPGGYYLKFDYAGVDVHQISPVRPWPNASNTTLLWWTWICSSTTSTQQGQRLAVWWGWCEGGESGPQDGIGRFKIRPLESEVSGRKEEI